MKNEEKQYRLAHGCWRGTITSRDVTEEMVSSEEEVRKKLSEHAAFYRSIGYSIWFATLYCPDGTEKRLA